MDIYFFVVLFSSLFILSGLWLGYRHTASKKLSQQLEKLERKNEERARISDDLLRKVSHESYEKLTEHLTQNYLQYQRTLFDFKESIQQALTLHRSQFDERQCSSLKLLQDTLQKGMSEAREELKKSLQQNSEQMSQRVDKLTEQTNARLNEISHQVEKRLSEGFEKTTATFTDVIKRLALIDEAQKKITELSTNVVSLQEILSDKRSRGAFGEVQLNTLIRNILPEKTFSFQYTLSNNKRADCILFLPEPTGNVVIDAKFPLENYRNMTNLSSTESERQQAEQQFRRDIRKHITDIASKYIIPNETSNGAVMFIPAEAIFSEIHAHFPDLVEFAQKQYVWLVSPTTMMAILTTAQAVLKDEATRKQIHIIQNHLSLLAKDFDRFQVRMNSLAKHIHQAYEDVDQVNTSAKKITSRFTKIEKVELEAPSLEEKDE